jgi:hypothetical protein
MMISNASTSPEIPFSILLIGTQMTTGGAQKGLLDQARCFQACGCKVDAAFIYDKDGLQEDWQQRAEFPIHNLRSTTKGQFSAFCAVRQRRVSIMAIHTA